MTIEEKVAKVDKTYADLKKFVDEGEYEYGAMLTRTIVEIIVNSYTDYYTPYIKGLEVIPTIMEQIIELDNCSSFPKAHIYNLHEMRKIGNIGAHQGTEKEVNGAHIKAMLPNIENEINAWKSFAAKGHESLMQIDKERKQRIISGSLEKDPKKVKSTLGITVVSLIAIFCLSISKTIQFFSMGLYYETSGLLVYWGCLITFFILAAYFRSYSKAHKILFNVFALYFCAPRLYQIFLCMRSSHHFFDGVLYLIFAVAIIGGYSILALHVDQKGGIVGYQ